MRQRGHGRRARHFLEGAFGTRQIATAIGRDADVVVNRRAVHAERERLLEQRQRLGKVFRIERRASLGETRLRFRGGGVRTRATQQRDPEEKCKRRAGAAT